MGKVLLIDITKCNGCYTCQLACKDEHVNNDWSPYAKPQPDIGQFWYKVTETVQGTVPKVRVHYMSEICQHCDKPVCIDVCKNDAIYKRDDGIVIIDPDKCRGSRTCVDSCPYGTIYFNRDLNIAQKCTFCAHLLDNEGWTEPRCVQSCQTDALIFGEEEDLKDTIESFEVFHPEYGTKPRVYYKGLLNKFFITGEIYDSVLDRCTMDAKVTLIDENGSEISTETTDRFGDFWFERCVPGIYSVRIEKDGYETVTIENIDATEKDINIGSIDLSGNSKKQTG